VAADAQAMESRQADFGEVHVSMTIGDLLGIAGGIALLLAGSFVFCLVTSWTDKNNFGE
jgi:hypothetical protein